MHDLHSTHPTGGNRASRDTSAVSRCRPANFLALRSIMRHHGTMFVRIRFARYVLYTLCAEQARRCESDR
mgnify:CR=1 FL=1